MEPRTTAPDDPLRSRTLRGTSQRVELSAPPTTSDPASVHRYPPLEHFFGPSAALGAQPKYGRLTPVRFAARLRSDSVFRLAVAIAIPVGIMESLLGDGPRLVAIVASVAFVATHVLLAAVNRPPRWWSLFRLGLCLVFVLLANVAIDTTGSWPLNALVVPVVALAASMGGRPAYALATIGVATSLIPLATNRVDAEADRAAVAIAMAAMVMAVGSRRIVSSLEHSADRLRRSNSRDRRRARQLGAVEAVGRLLAVEGPTRGALDQVMGLLEETFGFKYPSVYLLDGPNLRLAAYHNYETPIEVVPADKGVIGRTVRTGEPVLLRDARNDPDFWSADRAIVDEISIPLKADGEVYGVLNVESDISRRLDEDDLATMLVIGDRIAAAMALGRERQKLTERTELLGRLTEFATGLNASLEPEQIHAVVAAGAARVVGADIAVVVVRDDATGEYRSIAIDGADSSLVGTRVRPGDGVTGQAIESGSMVVVDEFHRQKRAHDIKARAALPELLAAMGLPMTQGDEVIGGIGFYRANPPRPFTPIEQEVAALVASRVAMALTNSRLHQQAQELAITDSLTGLHNRRHFDAAVTHADAQRERLTISERRARSAILFDLDHFGAINKRHGHQVGDQILRAFAQVLQSRVRASDLAARYGGEEFVVILEGATREEAFRLADEVRLAFRQQSIEAATANSELPITTVSAGCASLERIEVSSAVLLERADVGLAMAKAAGRDQVVAA